jgi:DNA replication protein DnaC
MDEKSVKSIRSLVSHREAVAGDVMQKPVGKLANTVLTKDAGNCPSCGGTGWRVVASGRERRVTRCDCFLQGQAQQLLKSSHIPSRYVDCDFSSYKAEANQGLTAARLVVEKWAEQYPLDRTGLLLIGPSGVGKTHLSVAALKQLTQRGVHCLFCDYRELLKQIQNSYNPSVQATELEVLRPVFETEVVLIDDIGAVKPSEWVWDTVSIILNTRYNNAQTTIITSNFLDGPAKRAGMSGAHAAGMDDTLGDRLGERMRSRLFEMCRLVQVDGKDYRQRFRTASR